MKLYTLVEADIIYNVNYKICLNLIIIIIIFNIFYIRASVQFNILYHDFSNVLFTKVKMNTTSGNSKALKIR